MQKKKKNEAAAIVASEVAGHTTAVITALWNVKCRD
jgi:hypothetical protein